MKTIIISVTTTENASTVQMRYGKFYAVESETLAGKRNLPYWAIVKCAFKIGKTFIKHKLKRRKKCPD